MTRTEQLSPEFVEYIPERPAPGVLYVSRRYGTALHLCCCGCKNEVVTPLSPTDWKLTFDGESISLHPSIGNWSFPCRSHYWIRGNRIEWAANWTDSEIRAGREFDRRKKHRGDSRRVTSLSETRPDKPDAADKPRHKRSVLQRILGWFRRAG